MKEKIISFLTSNLANPTEGLINSGLSIIRDKTRDADTSFIRESVKKGISVSSKRVLNLVGTSVVVSFALMDMQAKGINKLNILVLGIGVVFCAGMSFITVWKEK